MRLLHRLLVMVLGRWFSCPRGRLSPLYGRPWHQEEPGQFNPDPYPEHL